jgi:hypothetical protein
MVEAPQEQGASHADPGNKLVKTLRIAGGPPPALFNFHHPRRLLPDTCEEAGGRAGDSMEGHFSMG